MPLCQVTISANAGAALHVGGLRLWADALHRHKVPGFSCVTPELWARMKTHPAFAAPDILFYTHRHPDHYSHTLIQETLQLWPRAELVSPERDFADQILLAGSESTIHYRDISLRFRRLTHEGAEYVTVPHYGCLIDAAGFRILLTGDCALADPGLAEFIDGVPIDLAILDFPWITLKRGRTFVEEVIRPRHLLINHLPFAQDDIFGYRAAAAKCAAVTKAADVRLLQDPFQTEYFD